MARIAKPQSIKEIEGNPGKRTLAKEPKPLAGPAAPTVMSPRAKTVWGRLVKAMPPGVFTSCDSNLLAAYCEAVAMHQIATTKLIKGSHETVGSTGQIKVTPWFSAQSDAARLIVQLGAKLGLDPVSRQQINVDGGDKIDDEFGDLIH